MGKKDWYKDSYRRNLVDMHIEDWNGEFLSKFDPRFYFECLKKARIQSPMIYLHSHVGLCNWDSESGLTHRAFKGDNRIKTLIDLCHSEGMDVVGYYSLIFNKDEYERNPGWRMIDPKGNPSRSNKETGFMKGGRHGLICPNNGGYRSFLQKQFAELLDAYELEGVFLDMTFWPMICACESCGKRFMAETGLMIPKYPDWKDKTWLLFQARREEWMGEFADFCTAEFKNRQPSITVEHQFSTIAANWQFGSTDRIGDASDYAGGDLYGGHYQESFICKLYYEITKNQPFEYMTSRCEPFLSVHTTTKSVDVLRLHNLLVVAHHGAMLFIDAIDPAGTMDARVYDDIGSVFAESMPYEKYLKGSFYSDVAIYFDLKSKFNACARPDPEKPEHSVPQLDAALGASIAFSDANILYTAIPGGKREKIKDKRAVAVCEAPLLSDEEISDLARYVEGGGRLYISGATNPKLAGALLGLTCEGLTEENVTYISPTEKGAGVFGDRYTADIPLTYSGRQVLAKNPAGHDVLATITLPYTNPDDTSVFASIHSNPPGVKTEYPSLIIGGYGRGRVLWSASAFEKNPQKSHKRIWLNAFKLLGGDICRIEGAAPEHVQFTLFDDEADGCMYLNVVNVSESETISPVAPFVCSFRPHREVGGIESLPDEKAVESSVCGGRLEFTVDGLDIFRMYRIK